MSKILVDADALVALAKVDDSNHKKALRIASKLKDATFYVSSFAIPEASSVISYRVSQLSAIDFLPRVREQNLIELVLQGGERQEVDSIFIEQKTKGTSWFDCCNIFLYRHHKIDMIFSFDKFYKKNGALLAA